MASAVDLTVVIPAFNEASRLPATLARVAAWAERQPRRVEVIVVDDGSTDGTFDIARGAGPSVTALRLARNAGKGVAARTGVLAARGSLILVSDADLSTPIEELRHLRAAVESGAAVAIGSRSCPGARIGRPQPLRRRILGRAFNAIVQLLLLPGIHDTQCGFKLFTRAAAREIFGRASVPGFAFDVEILGLARRLGFTVCEVPVEWRDAPGSRVRARDPFLMLGEVVRLRAGPSRFPAVERRLVGQ